MAGWMAEGIDGAFGLRDNRISYPLSLHPPKDEDQHKACGQCPWSGALLLAFSGLIGLGKRFRLRLLEFSCWFCILQGGLIHSHRLRGMIAISSNDVDIAGLLSGRGTSDDHICHKGVVAGKKISRPNNTIIVGHSLREDVLDLLGAGDRQPLGYIP